jgi:hypothetical protein
MEPPIVRMWLAALESGYIGTSDLRERAVQAIAGQIAKGVTTPSWVAELAGSTEECPDLSAAVAMERRVPFDHPAAVLGYRFLMFDRGQLGLREFLAWAAEYQDGRNATSPEPDAVLGLLARAERGDPVRDDVIAMFGAFGDAARAQWAVLTDEASWQAHN